MSEKRRTCDADRLRQHAGIAPVSDEDQAPVIESRFVHVLGLFAVNLGLGHEGSLVGLPG